MDFLLDVLITVISLAFLSVLGLIAGAAIPGLFMPVAAPWLEKILPGKKRK